MSLFSSKQGLSNGYRAGELRPRWRSIILVGNKKTPVPTIRANSRACFDGLEAVTNASGRLMDGFGKTLIYLGLLLVIVGVIFTLAGKVPWFGHLPGDISIQKERFTFYFPITTCIVISIIISLVL